MKFSKILRNLDKPLLIFSIAFFIFGMLTIVTASSRAAVVYYDKSIYYYFYKELTFLGLGLIIGFFVLKTDTKYYKIWIYILFIAMVALNIVAWKSSGLKGSNNWINLGFAKMQPSELAKPVEIILIGVLLEKNYHKLRTKNIKERYLTILKLVILILLIPAIVLLQKDLGTFLIYCAIIFILFLASPILRQDKFVIILLLIILGFIGISVMQVSGKSPLNNARKSRFESWLDPCGQYENGGYQVCNSYIAINDGGLYGLGIGKSKQKYSYIPEPHTDSAFAIIAEEYGVISCSFIFMGFGFMLWRIFLISSRASTLRGRYIALGIGVYLFTHIFVNLGGLFGIIPLTGVPLPFFSYGGSFAISHIVSLCIVQRINVETKTRKVKIKAPD